MYKKDSICKRKVIFVLLIILCFSLVFSFKLIGTEFDLKTNLSEALLNWQRGDWWIIEVYYLQPSKEIKWVGPVKWKYQVINIEEVNNIECFHIKVNAVEPGKSETLDLFLETKNLYPVRVVNSFLIRGKRKQFEEDFRIDKERPIFSRISSIPYDMPVLSKLKKQSLDRIQSEVDTFDVKSKGKTPTAIKVSQKMTGIDYSTLEETFESLDLGYSEEFEKWDINYLSSKNFLSIELFVNNSAEVKQIWSPKFPWWFLSKSKSYKGKLVEFGKK